MIRPHGCDMSAHLVIFIALYFVVVEFYLKSQHKQAMAPPFIHASDMTNLIIIVMGRGGEK